MKTFIALALMIAPAVAAEVEALASTSHTDNHQYPNFDDSPYFNSLMRKAMRPHLLPLDHPAKHFLDSLFASGNIIEDDLAFASAGFNTISVNTSSFIHVARHPELPGYVFKVYLNNMLNTRNKRPVWRALTDRCEGAENISNLIKEKKLRFFSVPKKWLYVVPTETLNRLKPGIKRQIVLLVATDMHPFSQKASLRAWHTRTTKAHFKELYCILNHGYASTYLSRNIPYTRSGKFTCLDTEFPKRINDFDQVGQHVTKKMYRYWQKLQKQDEANWNNFFW